MPAARRYAEGTTVSPEKSRMEIDTFLTRQGARSFTVHVEDGMFAVQFQVRKRLVRFVVERPKPDSGVPFKRREDVRLAEERRRWRALLLVLKAKFEAVNSGITTFDREFLAHLVAASGVTVGDAIAPSLETALATGDVAIPLALPPGPPA